MAAREEVTPLLDIVLHAAVSCLKVKFEYIPLEYEQVVFNALLKAYEMGVINAHEKPTIPHRGSSSSSQPKAVTAGPNPFSGESTPPGFKRKKLDGR